MPSRNEDGGGWVRSEGAKPQEVLDLHTLTREVFEALRAAFDVPRDYAMPLVDVDDLTLERDPVDLAAFAMRHLQVIRRYAGPACPVATEHFVGITVDLVPTLEQLADLAADAQHRELLQMACGRFYAAAWAVVRDTGGPAMGLFELR